MSVIISPNIKKSSARVNLAGDIIDPVTKRPLEKIDKPDYVPQSSDFERATQPKKPKPEGANASNEPKNGNPEASAGSGPLNGIIKSELQRAIKAEVSKIDLKGMVADAIKEALE